MTQDQIKLAIDALNLKMEAAKWRGEPSGNPDKGWIVDSRGNKLTRLGSRFLYGQLITAHNNEIEVAVQQSMNALRALQSQPAKDDLHNYNN